MKKLPPIAQLINCGGTLIDLSAPKVMAIMNVTPDSFYDGGKLDSIAAVVDQAGKLIEDGADFLDLGGVSTRPKAAPVAETEELRRILPALEALRKAFPAALISIDTWRSEVVRQCLPLGIHLVNDISGGQFDDQMWATVGQTNLPYVFTHTQGKPANMQDNPTYQNVSLDICDFFAAQVNTLRGLGVNDILLDPGFGFGKTVAHNFQILHDLEGFRILGCPLLIGLSRKSMIWKTLDSDSTQALHGTTAAHMLALQNGASILRVHDVKPAKDCIRIFNQYALANS